MHACKSLSASLRLVPRPGSVSWNSSKQPLFPISLETSRRAAERASQAITHHVRAQEVFDERSTSPCASSCSFLAITFGVLIFGGTIIHRDKPPIPAVVRAENGQVVFTSEDVKNGQKLYLSRGGQDMGTIWGHGSYLAPDWSADYLHRNGLYVGARLSGLESGQGIRLHAKGF